jgi:1,4-alpha-glucan branching enzyme
MGIAKKTLKNKTKVTFTIPKSVGKTAASAYLVGDFNNWDTAALPMKKLKEGAFTATIDLETGKEYQFRYLIDGSWQNDESADKYVPSGTGDENSVISA